MKFARPINTGGNPANISTPFGPYHNGIDYAYPEGTKVYASEDGEVVIAKGNETRRWIANEPGDPYRIVGKTRALRTEDYGNFLKIAHGSGYATLYAHLKYDSLYVKVGDKVKKGQLIAEVGSTGNSTGNHTHWETRLNDATFDPSTMFDGEFKGYQDKQPAGQVAVDADIYPKIIFASSQWDKTVAEYKSGSDPKTTPFEDVRNIINGKLSRVTDLEKQVGFERTEKENREEQVSRLKIQLTDEEKLRKELQTKLTDAMKEPAKLVGVYEGQLKEKNATITEQGKTIGSLNHEVSDLKSQLKLAKERNPISLSLYEVIVLLIKKVTPFLQNTKL